MHYLKHCRTVAPNPKFKSYCFLTNTLLTKKCSLPAKNASNIQDIQDTPNLQTVYRQNFLVNVHYAVTKDLLQLFYLQQQVWGKPMIFINISKSKAASQQNAEKILTLNIFIILSPSSGFCNDELISLTPLTFFPTETHFQHFCISNKEIRQQIQKDNHFRASLQKCKKGKKNRQKCV